MRGGAVPVCWAAVVLCGLCVLLWGRRDRDVSFQGDLLGGAIGFRTLVVQHRTPEQMARSVAYVPYEYGSFRVPSGYENTQVRLSECEGYLLSRTGSAHDEVVYQIHGGAYVMGYGTQYDQNALLLSRANGGSDVFSIDYRTAAKSPYPAALDDAVEGYRWLLGAGYAPQDIVVAGDSAGGGLSLAMTLFLRDNAMPLPRCLVLASPWADLSQQGETYTTNRSRDVSFGSRDPAAVGRNALPVTYADGDSVYNPYISPVYAEFWGMPPMLIQTGEPEMLLSDSRTVAKKVREAGGQCTLIEYPGMWHTFYTMMSQCREQKAAWRAISDFLAE